MATTDLTRRFGFLVVEVAKLYGDRFDALARRRLGLSRAQCRLLAVLAPQPADAALSQAALAERLGVSAMAVTTLCDRMEAAGWLRRRAATGDRRVNEVRLEPRAARALDAALGLGDQLTARATAGLSAAERTQLVALLRKVRLELLALGDETGEAAA
ncbi:MAG: MarR family winged helix-turn-helix transcriptional regulator [Betaproteobacteria bacterium]